MGEINETPENDPSTPGRNSAGERNVDQAPLKVRRSRAELTELMLDGGVALLSQTGVEAQISSVTYVRVFEHIERTTGIKVTYGSVHERIWDSVAHYQLAVIERAGVFDRADDAWGDWLTAAVALVSGADDDPLTVEARAAVDRAYQAPTSTDDVDEVRAVLATAIADGLLLRAHLTGEPLPTVTVPTGPEGAPQQWALSDLAQWAVARGLGLGETTPEA